MLARTIIHVDFDYFFAQCEEVRDPNVRNRPIVVCVFSGRTEESGVVSTSNYVARRYGVKSGIPIRVAKAKLADAADALFLRIDLEYYKQISEKAMSAIRSNVDVLERVGMDECFADVSLQTRSDFGVAEKLAHKIKDDVREKAEISCSIGVAPNKMLAKVASDFRKPDSITVITPQNVKSFLARLDIGKIPGIGPKTQDRLKELEIKTIEDLAAFDIYKLIDKFGRKTATYLHNAAEGVDSESVIESEGQRKQLMRIVTLKQDATKPHETYSVLKELCDSISESARNKKMAFKSVGVILISNSLEMVTRSRTLKAYTTNPDILYETTRSILDETVTTDTKIRRLGIRVSEFQDTFGQNTLLDFMQR